MIGTWKSVKGDNLITVIRSQIDISLLAEELKKYGPLHKTYSIKPVYAEGLILCTLLQGSIQFSSNIIARIFVPIMPVADRKGFAFWIDSVDDLPKEFAERGVFKIKVTSTDRIMNAIHKGYDVERSNSQDGMSTFNTTTPYSSSFQYKYPQEISTVAVDKLRDCAVWLNSKE